MLIIAMSLSDTYIYRMSLHCCVPSFRRREQEVCPFVSTNYAVGMRA